MISFALSELTARYPFFELKGADVTINAVSTDSRTISSGALYVPLEGEKFDGHDFIESAASKGAAAFVCQKERFAAFAHLIDKGFSAVVCENTRLGLGLLGKFVKDRILGLTTVAITGSCGKTTVKELTAAILSECGKTAYTKGNFNNDVGVPLTLLSLTSDCRYAVIEQGANHPGEIAYTCQFVGAKAALINNVGGAHLEGFGSNYGIYKGKSEILEDVFKRGGIGIVPSDSEFAANWQHDFEKEYALGRLRFFGSHLEDFVQVADIKVSAEGVSFTLKALGQSGDFYLPLPGAHNAYNAAAACALALSVGAPFAKIGEAFSKVKAVKGRLHQEKLFCGVLIDDSYNASFNSVLSGLEVLKLQEGFKIFCFADMGELGSEALSLHEKVGEKAAACCDLFFGTGPLTEAAVRRAQALGLKASHFADREALTEALRPYLEQGGVCVLIKGSHSMRMNEIAAYMREHYPC